MRAPNFLLAADAAIRTFLSATRALLNNWWYSETMLGKVIGFGSFVSVVLLIVLLQTTTPATIGPFGVLVVFVLMYIAVLGVLSFFIFGVNKLITKVRTGGVPITLGRAYYFASVLALGPIIVVGMHSVGEVGVYELSLVTLFLVIACIYISKRSA